MARCSTTRPRIRRRFCPTEKCDPDHANRFLFGLASVHDIDGEAGPALVILRDSMGALRGPPVRLALPAPAKQLILGDFGGDLARDLAVVAGNSLWILNGSERGEITSLEAVPQAGSVLAVADGGRRLAVLSATGDLAFMHRSRSDSKASGEPAWVMTVIARIDEPVTDSDPGNWSLTSCRLSTAPTRDLLVQDLKTGRLQLVMTSPPQPPTLVAALRSFRPAWRFHPRPT